VQLRKKEHAEWRAQDDLRTIAAARAIEADKTRMSAVKAVAQKQVQALNKVVGKPSAPARKSPVKK
jgi:hypothetical protein